MLVARDYKFSIMINIEHYFDVRTYSKKKEVEWIIVVKKEFSISNL